MSFLLLAVGYAPPPRAPGAASQPALQVRPDGAATRAVIIAGCVWGLYNAGLGVIFGFGTLMLTGRGWTLTAAASATSIVLWLMAISVPFGGWIGDRSGRHFEVLTASLVLFAAALIVAARVEDIVPALVILGLICGLPAGLIMRLPMQALPPNMRAIGMGVFFTLFYFFQFSGPWAAGRAAALSGRIETTFDLGAAIIVAALLCVVVFRSMMQRRSRATV
jgi:MFS family permease